mmetsp:Transcript_27254/g.59551  ORF Transcript_27254/g.59551 Transcript_27254/m.59551 type:complete len:207 (-) Transcript_27254:719-1339(-)|eukprot:CAMPEP_0202901784 /NCGR_PEP_ID=MMETSP1392-20130828/14652_1 /ASSEMBLY_ACC=CAM_ASM_000868 /TAXON_ID=225041 /ORGANISM="Chlamydomonas chlamydogama, Strain SAG 11-48b" /LENGTH=206 /DNA_ID=CAMNT_0049588399 /DNA_START=199 /DNA_END=819 /DNA_ORIENTATION=-
MGRKEDVITKLKEYRAYGDGQRIGSVLRTVRTAGITENMLRHVDLSPPDRLIGNLENLIAQGVPDAFYARVTKSNWLLRTNHTEMVRVTNPVSPSLLAGYAGYKLVSPRSMVVNETVMDFRDLAAAVQLGKVQLDGRGTPIDPVQIRFQGMSFLPLFHKYANSTTVMGLLNMAATLAMGLKTAPATTTSDPSSPGNNGSAINNGTI